MECVCACMYACMHVCVEVEGLLCVVCVGGSIKNSSNERQLEKQQFLFHKTGESEM